MTNGYDNYLAQFEVEADNPKQAVKHFDFYISNGIDRTKDYRSEIERRIKEVFYS